MSPIRRHRARHAAAGRLSLLFGFAGAVVAAWGIASASLPAGLAGGALLALGVAFAYGAGRARAAHRVTVRENRLRAVVRR